MVGGGAVAAGMVYTMFSLQAFILSVVSLSSMPIEEYMLLPLALKMKVLDPQAALMTTAEVHQFLSSHPPRPKQKKIGTYQPVDLKNYNVVRDDFQHYIATTVPYTLSMPEAFIKNVVPRLRRVGLTKTEALMLINLGVGAHRNGSQQKAGDAAPPSFNGNGEELGEEAAEVEQEQDDRQLLSLVVEELEERFPGEEGEAMIDSILQIIKDAYQDLRPSNEDPHITTLNGTLPT
ncbi:uncharacterized protein A1O9_03013 [Exophiala aquamarina CBS 119918]|uniref:DNA-directed RNA polymerase III subunit RPC9 n=1 Tax=Exophiala aquamarina CBS 119918 TaxID=1182545 RepID=A0A072PNY1_9EURO|nr:uncharacterized protein A1O9_03013 [Exophiala aquamarina CBS 119918]KEF61447.1 hypothetical protein A1O9_03013 [Exophiala aquamarina CBS 119918]